MADAYGNNDPVSCSFCGAELDDRAWKMVGCGWGPSSLIERTCDECGGVHEAWRLDLDTVMVEVIEGISGGPDTE